MSLLPTPWPMALFLFYWHELYTFFPINNQIAYYIVSHTGKDSYCTLLNQLEWCGVSKMRWKEVGRSAQLNSLCWQQCGKMIVGNCLTADVECVAEWGTEWEDWSGGGVCLCVKLCGVRLLSCVEKLPVSGRLSCIFFIWSFGAMSTAWGDTAWPGMVESASVPQYCGWSCSKFVSL